MFSSWVHVIEKAPIINCSLNSKSLKGMYFFLRNSKVEIFQESQCFFMFTCVHYSFPIFDWLCFYINSMLNLRFDGEQLLLGKKIYAKVNTLQLHNLFMLGGVA